MVQSAENNKIQAHIIEFVVRNVPNPVTFYRVEVENNSSKWSLDKRFSQFSTLFEELNKQISNPPILPKKTFFKMKNHEDLEKRKIELDIFLKGCVQRSDILNHASFREFLELDSHSLEVNSVGPSKLGFLEDQPLGIRDFILLEKEGILILALSDMKIGSRIDAYLTNVTFPWEKHTDSHVTVGALLVYKINVNSEEISWKFERIWVKSFPFQTSVLVWDVTTRILAVGMDDGKINCLRLPAEHNFLQYEEYCSIKAHNGRVMGLAIDSKKGFLYSCGEDKRFCVYDINYQEKMEDILVSTVGLKVLLFDAENSRVFMASALGELFIYSLATQPPSLLGKSETGMKAIIRGLEVDYLRGLVFTCNGSFNGGITIFDIGKPGKERFVKPVSSLSGKEKARCLAWRPSKSELLVAHESGHITIWSTKAGKPIYVFEPHKEAVTNIQWDEKKNRLITVSKDKKLKIWKLPEKWEVFQPAQPTPITTTYTSMPTIQAVPKKEQFKKADSGSDDDDLLGWEQ